MNELKKVMVIGGGIAGLTTAYELSLFGVHVDLIEKSCFLGGHAIGYSCKAAEECVQCGACSVEDMLKKVVEQDNIDVHLSTEITSVQNGKTHKVTLSKSELSEDDKESALLRGFSINNKPLNVIINKETCGSIPEGSVDYSELGFEGEIEVDAVVLATGFSAFDASIKSQLSYKEFDNVINGLELEQIKRETGKLLRPSDGKQAKKIAFIQCVGSRDERLGNLWCSQVCCSYALKTARSLKYKDQELDVTVFYMDIQNTGRDFPVFYEKCKDDIKFLRTIPADIYPAENDDLLIRYMVEEDGNPANETYDLVALSVGIMPGDDNEKISKLLGTGLDSDGFITNGGAGTDQEGVFVTGTATGPANISTVIAQSDQAACEVLKYLGVS
ncbi:MAG: CoB--CoM heterodisulfide reductase iron-sulfur subunit A family protein [Desulfobacterales bacterium]|nr:CoB--CoM heterodisulfide reductase iron-sulfur subunit A family protein [Desulfobacterales bacterium]MCP4160027.1 CoB--CoM heterodisulfide reductase iron-sulfur subunit A family protein [Deltaproteobacteria bacterium]